MAKRGARKLQRKVNAVVRKQNKALEEDNLWRGRFVVRQKQAVIHEYSDKSGWFGSFVMRIYDKKTGLYKEECFDYHDFIHGWKFWYFVNYFIVHDVKVWEEKPSPGDEGFVPKKGYKDVPLRAAKLVGWEKRLSGKRYM